MMLGTKLLVEQDNEMSRELLRKIFMQKENKVFERILSENKIAFVESSDYKAKERACKLSRRMNLIKGLKIGCTTLLDKANGGDTRFHFMTTEMMLKQICMQPKLDDYRATALISGVWQERKDRMPSMYRGSERRKQAAEDSQKDRTKVITCGDHKKARRRMITARAREARRDRAERDRVREYDRMIRDHERFKIKGTSDEYISTAKRLSKTSNVGFERKLYVFAYEEFTSRSVVSTGSRRAILTKENLVDCLMCPTIKYIVDTGFCILKTFDSQFKAEIEMVSRIPKTLAIDRRSDLTSMVLLLAGLGIHVHDIGAQKFVNQPPSRLLNHGLVVLEALGDIDFEGKVTPVGKLMAKLLPLNPMTAKCMLVSKVHRCSTKVATIFAMIKSKVLIENKGEEPGDHIYLMKLYNSWDSLGRSRDWCKRHSVRMHLMVRAQKTKERLESAMQLVGISITSNPNHTEAIAKTITSADIDDFEFKCYCLNVAKLKKPGRYVTIKNKQIVEIAESSVLYKQVCETSKVSCVHKHGGEKEVEVVTEIKEEWLYVAYTGYSISEKPPSIVTF
uniref:RNA helicase n=1 Tax=Tanacetum cinerariifolium TaxID=118510 RepID=A0A699GUN9_TANCI|nr:hypothetical protein [Tanacetum cinerariifolium]